MKTTRQTEDKFPRFTLAYMFLVILWSALIVLLAMYQFGLDYKRTCEMVKANALEAYNHDIIYRRWATGHGGVYVPVTESTQPNPFLAHIPDRDITTSDGKKLTLINHAYMTRQVYEIGPMELGMQGHITSLNPLREKNAPDAWEKQALESFLKGSKEAFGIEKINGENFFRFMRPVFTEEGCLKCHAIQGYKAGDIKGGISISTPWEPIAQKIVKHKIEMAYSFAGIWLAGIIGLAIFMRIINKNVRKQKKLQTVLEQSEKKYRTLFTQISLGMAIHEAIYDASGKITDFRILEVNKSFEDILKFKASEIVGKSVHDVFPQIENNLLEKFGQIAEFGATLKYDHYFADLGKHLDLLACQTQPGQFALVFNDISDRKINEEKIIRSEAELKELNATKDKFFSIIAHDLKSPFSSIVGFSEILINQAHKKSIPEIINYAKIIMNASLRAMDMLVNLIEWSRVQTGKTEIYAENFSLDSHFESIIFQFSDIAKDKSVSITRNLPADILVNSDQTILNSVLRNLTSNAVKFTNAGGEVIISAEEKEDHILVSVKDNGMGIPEDKIRLLFRIDENYSTPGTANETGTGLGLILCKELIEKLGGMIWAESELGKGSVFSFTIPKKLKPGKQNEN